MTTEEWAQHETDRDREVQLVLSSAQDTNSPFLALYQATANIVNDPLRKLGEAELLSVLDQACSYLFRTPQAASGENLDMTLAQILHHVCDHVARAVGACGTNSGDNGVQVEWQHDTTLLWCMLRIVSNIMYIQGWRVANNTGCYSSIITVLQRFVDLYNWTNMVQFLDKYSGHVVTMVVLGLRDGAPPGMCSTFVDEYCKYLETACVNKEILQQYATFDFCLLRDPTTSAEWNEYARRTWPLAKNLRQTLLSTTRTLLMYDDGHECGRVATILLGDALADNTVSTQQRHVNFVHIYQCLIQVVTHSFDENEFDTDAFFPHLVVDLLQVQADAGSNMPEASLAFIALVITTLGTLRPTIFQLAILDQLSICPV